MPQVLVCPFCREEVGENDRYVMTPRDQYGFEKRVHVECLPSGTHLRVLGPPIHHEGTYVGPLIPSGEDVIHSDKPEGGILSHFDEFGGGGRVEIVALPRSPEEGREIVRRAIATLGVRYDLLGINGLNCEQAANFAKKAEAISPTLRVVVGVGVAVGLLWLFGREN